LSRSDAAIAGNQAAVDVLRRKGYRGPVRVIPQFGFDPALFYPADERPQRPFTIGYVGRFELQKGVADLFEAAAGLRGDWRVRLVGYGPLEAELRARATRAGIRDRVEIRPRVASTDIPSVYRELDALVLPSRSTRRWIEQFGRVLPEAMACGVPTIASSCGELPNVIGDAGLVYPEGDVDALRADLQRLIDDHALRADLIERGFRRFRERYTMAAVARATHEVYRSALNRSRASASD
jgi:glycosyltransferase involved in cell wall biosynthesis